MNEEYQKHLDSPYWKEVAETVKKKAGYRCQVCDDYKQLTVHHRRYSNVGNEAEHLDDLICLCWPCHKLFHERSSLKGAGRPRKTERAIRRQRVSLNIPKPLITKGKSFLITKENVYQVLTRRNGVSRQLHKTLGIKEEAGWKKRLIGKSIPLDTWLKVLALNGRQYIP